SHPINLTKHEFELLQYMMQNPNLVFSRTELVNKLYPYYEQDILDRTIDAHIKKIREKIDVVPARTKRIKTVRRTAYKLVSQYKKRSFIPKGFLWQITFLNIFVIVLAISLSGLAIYNTACYLVEGIGALPAQRQQQFNATLYQYLLVFTIIGILLSSVLHFYFTKRLVGPIKQLNEATEILKKRAYPETIQTTSKNEVGELVTHYNELINQLKLSHAQREKLVTNLSHELRTPVANLQGYLYALKTRTIEGDSEL